MYWSFWLYLAALVVYTGCLVRYGLGSPWWTGWTGRAQFSLYAALVAVLAVVVISRFLTLPPLLLVWLRVAFMGFVVAVGVAHFINIGRLQARRRERGAPQRRATDRVIPEKAP